MTSHCENTLFSDLRLRVTVLATLLFFGLIVIDVQKGVIAQEQFKVSFGIAQYIHLLEGRWGEVTVTLNAPWEGDGNLDISLILGALRGGASDADLGFPNKVAFQSGETNKTFIVMAVDDSVREDLEYFYIYFDRTRLPKMVEVDPEGMNYVRVRIRDEDGIDLSFSLVDSLESGTCNVPYTVEEGSATSVGVKLSRDDEDDIFANGYDLVIPLQVGVTSSAQNDDYALPGQIRFRNGETQKTFTVRATNDYEYEEDEFIDLLFGELPEDVRTTCPTSARVTLLDDDPAPATVAFVEDDYEAEEGGADALVAVTLRPAQDHEVVIPLVVYETLWGATEEDYTFPAAVTFAPGETMTTVTVTANDDADADSGEIVRLAFGSLPAGVIAAPGQAVTEVTLLDDDPPLATVAFVEDDYKAEEGGGDALVAVTLHPAQDHEVVIPLVVHETPGGATEEDYTFPAVVTFAPGETMTTVTVTANDDADADSGEIVRLAFGSLPAGVIAAPGQAVTEVTLLDDDPPPGIVKAIERTVRAVTAATAANITANIGTRFSATRSGGNMVVVGGRTLNLGSAPTPSSLPVTIGRDWDLFAEPDHVDDRWDIGLDDLLRSSAFELSLSAAEDGVQNGGVSPQWTVWGRGDLQFFESQPERGATYDGDLKAGYLGIDARLGDRWLAGLATSLTRAEADYDPGDDSSGGDGVLGIRMRGVHPYLRYAPDAKSDFWTILGAGRGEIENERAADGTRETSDITMWMGAAGARRSLVSVEALDLALLGDVGFARVETEDGLQAIHGLTVDSWRARLGVEGSHTASLASGATLTSFVEVAGRYDGGDGDDEVGLEVSPGLYISDPSTRFGLEVRGRVLALHSAENYKERGVSMTASLSPGSGGVGLSLSLSPRWGANTEEADTLWRDATFERLESGAAQHHAMSFDARVGYGVRAMSGLLTPFGEFSLWDQYSQQMRLGARFNRQHSGLGALSLELSGERREGPVNDPEHRVGVIGRLRF